MVLACNDPWVFLPRKSSYRYLLYGKHEPLLEANNTVGVYSVSVMYLRQGKKTQFCSCELVWNLLPIKCYIQRTCYCTKIQAVIFLNQNLENNLGSSKGRSPATFVGEQSKIISILIVSMRICEELCSL